MTPILFKFYTDTSRPELKLEFVGHIKILGTEYYIFDKLGVRKGATIGERLLFVNPEFFKEFYEETP
jgi:hypothetical protein